MTPETAAPIETYLDRLALAIAGAAAWWRNELRALDARARSGPALTEEQLDAFEGHLCLGMAKLLMTNAQRGLSWRHWVVKTTRQQPDEVLATAATSANIALHRFPFHTGMRLKSTADEVHVHVRRLAGASHQIWPKTAV